MMKFDRSGKGVRFAMKICGECVDAKLTVESSCRTVMSAARRPAGICMPRSLPRAEACACWGSWTNPPGREETDGRKPSPLNPLVVNKLAHEAVAVINCIKPMLNLNPGRIL